MNIAILISQLGGGGAERVAQIVGNYYVDHGHKVLYLLQDNNIKQDYPVKGEIVNTGIKSCMTESGISDLHRFMHLIKAGFQMRKLKRKYKIDAAISFMEESNYINVLSKGKERVVTRICTILSDRKELNSFLYKKNIVHFFYSKADYVVIMSDYARKDMRDHYGISAKRLVKISNAVISNDVGKDEREWMYGPKTLVCVGRVEEVKQQDRIIRAFSYVAALENEAKLLVLGKGPNLNYLKGLSSILGIEDKVIFEGFTDNVMYYLRHSRAFVMASRVEGFPNSMIEAMNCGLPVITTDSPGACGEIVGKPKDVERVDDIMFCKYGILTPNVPVEKLKINSQLSKQEKILGDAMLKVLTDDSIFEKYRKRSLRRAQMYTLDRVIRKWNLLIGVIPPK